MTAAEVPTLQTGGNRQDRILHWLQAEGRLDVADAAGRLGVAPETVRRDLRALELDQKLQRVHGGAVPVPVPALPVSTASDDRLGFADRVWRQLPRSGTLLIGAGRLATALAQAVVARPPESDGLTVVTNHLDVAVLLSRAPRLSVYNLGGSVSRRTHAQEGDWALTELTRLHTDLAVLSPPGLTVDGGLTEQTPAAAAVTRAVVDGTQRVLVLADAEVLATTAFVRACGLEEIHALAVTDEVAPAAVQVHRDRGLDVIGPGPDDTTTMGSGER